MRALALISSVFALAACSAGPYDLLASGRDAGCASGRYRCFAETVYDPQADLSWQRDLPRATTWDEARSACGARPPARAWRLPTEDELKGLAQPGTSPQIDLDAFPGTPAAAFWTSHESGPFSAFTVDFTTLAVETNAGSAALNYRCVRPGR